VSDNSSISKLKANRQATGQTGEFLVASELARRGYSVALPSGNAKDYDLLAYKDQRTRVVQVKCIAKGSFQFSLDKFMVVHMDSDKQIIKGLREDLDRHIDFVIVFLGKKIGEDKFFCTTLGIFADFAKENHENILKKNGGRRGVKMKNPKSLHAGYKQTDLVRPDIFKDFDQFFGS
jgi:PD-(D/E)XK endonuclease